MPAAAIVAGGMAVSAFAKSQGAKAAAGAQVDAANQAAGAYREAAQRAMGEINSSYDTGRTDINEGYDQGMQYLDPYLAGDQSGNQAYLASLGLLGKDAQNQSYENYQETPGYQFAMQQGLRGVDNSAASRGLNKSGAAIKGVLQYSQGLANQEFGRWQDRLQGLSSLGHQLANETANRSQTKGQNLADLARWRGNTIGSYETGVGASDANSAMAAGQARAEGKQAQWNALSGLAGGIAGKTNLPGGGFFGGK